MLSQLQDDRVDRPITFFSRKLLLRERNYSTVEKECLGIVAALGHFELHLVGQEFHITTDHRALKYLNRWKMPTLDWRDGRYHYIPSVSASPTKPDHWMGTRMAYPVRHGTRTGHLLCSRRRREECWDWTLSHNWWTIDITLYGPIYDLVWTGQSGVCIDMVSLAI